jgi:hypothetical protein
MKTLLILAVTLLSFCVRAEEMHLVAGMRSDSADATTSGSNVDGKANFQAGGIGYWDTSDNLKLRSGLVYTQRSYDVQSGSTVVSEPRLSYLDIPISGLFKINDFAGAFAGLNGSFNINKDCGSGSCTGVNTFPIAGQLGGAFEIADRLGLELYYEHGLTKIADDIENPRVFVGQLTYAF